MSASVLLNAADVAILCLPDDAAKGERAPNRQHHHEGDRRLDLPIALPGAGPMALPKWTRASHSASLRAKRVSNPGCFAARRHRKRCGR